MDEKIKVIEDEKCAVDKSDDDEIFVDESDDEESDDEESDDEESDDEEIDDNAFVGDESDDEEYGEDKIEDGIKEENYEEDSDDEESTDESSDDSDDDSESSSEEESSDDVSTFGDMCSNNIVGDDFAKRLFIRNLPKNVDNELLFETFRIFGLIQSCNVATDTRGLSLGYGFVNYISKEDASKAIENMHGFNFQNHFLVVQQYSPKENREMQHTVFVKNFGTSLTEKLLHDMFSVHGEIKNTKIMLDDKGNSKGYGFVNYSSKEAMANAIKAFDGKIIDGRKLTVCEKISRDVRLSLSEDKDKSEEKVKAEDKAKKIGDKSKSVYVKNFGSMLDDEELRLLFSAHGEIESCKVEVDKKGNSRGFGFVNFKQIESVEKAILHLNGFKLGVRVLHVSKQKSKADRDFDEEVRKVMKENENYESVVLQNFEGLLTEETITKIFSKHGIIKNCKIWINRLNGIGIISYESIESVNNAIEDLNGMEIGGRAMSVCRAKSFFGLDETQNSVLVEGIYDFLDDESLNKIFSKHGEIVFSAILQSHRKQWINGFVTYMTAESAGKAIEDFNGMKVGFERIKVSYCTEKDLKKATLRSSHDARDKDGKFFGTRNHNEGHVKNRYRHRGGRRNNDNYEERRERRRQDKQKHMRVKRMKEEAEKEKQKKSFENEMATMLNNFEKNMASIVTNANSSTKKKAKKKNVANNAGYSTLSAGQVMRDERPERPDNSEKNKKREKREKQEKNANKTKPGKTDNSEKQKSEKKAKPGKCNDSENQDGPKRPKSGRGGSRGRGGGGNFRGRGRGGKGGRGGKES